MADYKLPALGAVLATPLAIAGLAVGLHDTGRWILLVLAAVVALVSVTAALWRWQEARIKRKLAMWLRPALTPVDTATTASISDVEPDLRSEELRKLRRAANELIAELEIADARVDEDDQEFWRRYNLPVHRWEEHGPKLAEYEDDTYRAVHRAYHEVDRMTGCINSQLSVGGYGEPPSSTNCDIYGFNTAVSEGLAALQELLGRLPKPPTG